MGRRQLLAGASGPVLDVFFLGGKLSKHQVVATKAATQSIGHALKLVYYGVLVTSGFGEATAATGGVWIYGVVIVLGIAGSIAGGYILDRMSDDGFRKASRIMIMVIGAIYLAKGVAELL